MYTNILIIFIATILFASGEEANSHKFDPDKYLELVRSGVSFDNDDIKWIQASDKPTMKLSEVAKNYNKIIDLAKKQFTNAYKNREIVYSKVNITLKEDQNHNEDVDVVQVIIYYRTKGVTNTGTYACVGYLVRSDERVREQVYFIEANK